MKENYTHPLSAKELADLPDDAIDTSDIPELDEAFWENAKVVQPSPKTTVSLQLPEEVFAYFKAENPK